jgi:putative spermidine/putrescine transport system permease protein
MTISRSTRIVLRVLTVLILGFVYVPLLLVLVNSFSVNKTFAWPPRGFTLEWWRRAAESQGALDALWVSVRVGLAATVIALVLGTMVAFALQRFAFYGRDTVSLLVILPIALPGIVTGIALNNAFRTIFGWELGFFTIVIAHATFCIVTVFNNVIARLRRTGVALEQASADLGASGFTTFRLVTFPMIRSALLAGALLAFALSFDEIVVTNFTAGAQQTLPLWIYNQFRLPNTAQEVNAVAVFVIALTAIPVYLAQRLMRESGGIGGRG